MAATNTLDEGLVKHIKENFTDYTYDMFMMNMSAELEEIELDNEFQDETANIDDATILLEDFSAKTNPTVQELTDNIKKYI